MLLGDPRQSDQRTQSFHFPIVVHQSLDPAAQSSPRSSAKLLVFTCTSEFERSTCRLRTRRRVGSTRRRGNHMHDHSRFQRDINDVTGISLSLSLSLSPLTKVTDAQYRKRFRASYNYDICACCCTFDQGRHTPYAYLLSKNSGNVLLGVSRSCIPSLDLTIG